MLIPLLLHMSSILKPGITHKSAPPNNKLLQQKYKRVHFHFSLKS